MKERKGSPPIGELFGNLFHGVQMEELCTKSHTVVFVCNVGHPCQREDVCEVAPILQSHNCPPNFKFGAEKGRVGPAETSQQGTGVHVPGSGNGFQSQKKPCQR